jgi:hypothetical protein
VVLFFHPAHEPREIALLARLDAPTNPLVVENPAAL